MRDPRECLECGQRCALPFVGRFFGSTFRLCPICAGQLCKQLIRYFAGRKRDGLTRGAPPRNRMLPRKDAFGHLRCRVCEVRLDGWKPGDEPVCEGCRKEPMSVAL